MNIARSIRFDSISPRLFAVKMGIAISLIFGLIAMPTIGYSQTSTTGQVSGSIVDESGAAVPSATVELSRAATGFVRSVSTSESGSFTFAKVPVGEYQLKITKAGFKESTVKNVVVNVASVTNQTVTLEVGAVNEVVVVSADAVQVETQTGTVGEIVSGEQVRELPLNGRSFVQLTQLQPGVSAANNFDSKQKGLFGGVDFSVNGNSAQSNLFLTDGANNNDTGSNRTILLFPSIEAIAEFKTLRNSYGPEYGQAAGAVISIVTRGGSNEFHGSLFYFGRNDALNATEFFTRGFGGQKDVVRRNDFGGSIGGPIVKDKLFFFYSQEFNREIRGQSRFGSVPTLAERQGDFSNPRFDAAGNPCSGPAIGNGQPGEATQIIPAADLSPAGLALVQLFPQPNTATSTCINWATSANSPINFREENVRIDYNVNSKNRIFGRYTQDTWTNASPILVGNLWGDDAFPTVESSWSQPSKQLALKLTTEISSTSVNEVQFSYSANRINVDPGNGGDINQNINSNLPGFYPDSDKVNGLARPHPVFWGGIAPYFSSSGSDLWTQSPFRNSLDIYSIRNDFSTVQGNHTFKMGFLYDTAGKDEDSGPNNETPQFWGACCANNSGNYLADVLTRGSFFGFGESNTQAVGQTRYKNLEFYLGDSWKVRQNVTLEIGARYSIFYEPVDARDRISSFRPLAYDPGRPASDPCNGLVVPIGTNPCAGIAGASTPLEFSNRALRENNYSNFAPRLGFAWDVFSNGKTAIRAGFGQFFLRERIAPIFAALTTNSPFVATIGGQRTLDGPTPTFSGLGAASNGAPRFGLSPEPATPYSLQFNFSIGQELWRDAAIEVGYVGNRARKQLTHSDVNQVLDQNRLAAAFAADANAVNALRPFSNYGSIYIFERNGRADYDSLQLLFRTRLTNKSQFQAAYTYSRSLADFGLNDSSGTTSNFAVLNRNDRGLDFAESDINRPHIFVANAIYNLPSFRDQNAFVQNVLGGWEVASIIQVSSGTSLTPQINATGISPGAGQGFQAGLTGTGTAVANQRPLRVPGEPCTVNGGDAQAFINPNAFTLVGYQIGEDIPNKTTCLGPPTKNVDFSIYKNFTPKFLTTSALGEGARIQFRLELFNAFNTAQFRGDQVPLLFYNGPVSCGANPCSATNNVITQAGAAGNFGIATGTRGAREIQYALKLIF